MKSNLYISNVSILKEIPDTNYLAGLPVVKNLKDKGSIQFNKNVTFLVGENGVGKSTLIEGIAVGELQGHRALHCYKAVYGCTGKDG